MTSKEIITRLFPPLTVVPVYRTIRSTHSPFQGPIDTIEMNYTVRPADASDRPACKEEIHMEEETARKIVAKYNNFIEDINNLLYVENF